jgi:hypothetical protein
MDNEVACAVHAITQRTTNTNEILMTPIWPITTLDGNFERVFAAFMTDGPKNEDPKPAMVKLMESMRITSTLLLVPTIDTAAIPAIKDKPESSEAFTANSWIE